MVPTNQYNQAPLDFRVEDETNASRVITCLDRRSDEEGLSFRSRDEKLVFYSHWCESPLGRVLLREELSHGRQSQAYQRCAEQEALGKKPSYHALANLYYSLKKGDKTLGNSDSSRHYVQSFQGLKGTGITSPHVLLLGFSTNYSLENLAAILHLVGFSESRITALDRSEEPLTVAREAFGNKLYSSSIEYVQADATRPLSFHPESFDSIVTHLFFTHIPHPLKRAVIANIERLLKPERNFVDQEIILPSDIDMGKLVSYFRTLAGSYHGPEHHQVQISRWMHEFGSHPILAFPTRSAWREDFSSAHLQLSIEREDTTNVYEQGNVMVKLETIDFIARKKA